MLIESRRGNRRIINSLLLGLVCSVAALPAVASTINPFATNPDDTRFHGTEGPVKLTYPNPLFTAPQFGTFDLIATVENTLDFPISIRLGGIGATEPLGLGVIADFKTRDNVFGPFTIAPGATFTGSFAKMVVYDTRTNPSPAGIPPGTYTNQFANFDYCPLTDSPCQTGVNTSTQTVYENYTVVVTPGVPPISGGDTGGGGNQGNEVPEPHTSMLALSGFVGILLSKWRSGQSG